MCIVGVRKESLRRKLRDGRIFAKHQGGVFSFPLRLPVTISLLWGWLPPLSILWDSYGGSVYNIGGETGIRTLGRQCLQRFSKPSPSATQPSLQQGKTARNMIENPGFATDGCCGGGGDLNPVFSRITLLSGKNIRACFFCYTRVRILRDVCGRIWLILTSQDGGQVLPCIPLDGFGALDVMCHAGNQAHTQQEGAD